MFFFVVCTFGVVGLCVLEWMRPHSSSSFPQPPPQTVFSSNSGDPPAYMVSEASPYLLSSPCCSCSSSHFRMLTFSASVAEGFSGVAVVVVAASTRVNNARAAVEEEDVVVFMEEGTEGTRESGASHTDKQVTALRSVWFLNGAKSATSLRFLCFKYLHFPFLITLHHRGAVLSVASFPIPDARASVATANRKSATRRGEKVQKRKNLQFLPQKHYRTPKQSSGQHTATREYDARLRSICRRLARAPYPWRTWRRRCPDRCGCPQLLGRCPHGSQGVFPTLELFFLSAGEAGGKMRVPHHSSVPLII